MLPDSILDLLCEVFIGPFTSGKTHKPKSRGKQSAIGQVVDGGHDLLACKISRHPEENEAAGPGDLGEAPISGVT